MYGSILDLVGDSPIVEIRRLGSETPRAKIFAKSELVNPGGSVKDRICLAIIEAAEREGLLEAGRRHHRADQRQHRHRARARLHGQGLPLHPDHARDA